MCGIQFFARFYVLHDFLHDFMCGMCRCMDSTFVFCTVDQRNLVYMHTSPNVYASWVVPPSGATRATVSTAG